MIKNSRQRNTIMQLLMNRTDHPTAAMLYQDVQKELPRISLATVYRNLRLLEEMGEVIKVNVGDDSEHFDANVSPHYHHVCHRCGAVNDVMIPLDQDIENQARRLTEYRIDAHEVVFHGICKKCLEEEAKELLPAEA